MFDGSNVVVLSYTRNGMATLTPYPTLLQPLPEMEFNPKYLRVTNTDSIIDIFV
jgi:hypothetical protein